MPDSNVEYVNSTDYNKWKDKIGKLKAVMDDLQVKLSMSRRLRYTEVDIEAEKKSGKLAPDEVYVSQHIIDSNIRREQSAYIQYITQSPRAVVMSDFDTPSNDTSIIERDVTNRIRYEGWQGSLFRTIDGFQQNGYSIMELCLDVTKAGSLVTEDIPLGDFGYVMDSKDIQACELTCRNYYFTKTRLLSMVDDTTWGFIKEEVDKVVGKDNTNNTSGNDDSKDKSLLVIEKVMFRVKGVVHVGWCCHKTCDNWLRAPRPLFIGRQKQLSMFERIKARSMNPFGSAYETQYPYFVFPYLITEDNTLSKQKGRVYLDQDTQEAASSLMSSYCTAHRRASGLYFSKDTSDPNDDVLMQKNVYFKTGALINSKVQQFQLSPPSADMLGAIQALVTANQAETSQVNFAVNNRKDSRKTAEEIKVSASQQSQLSTVQVVLFATTLKQLYNVMFDIIRSRVLAKILVVNPTMYQLYSGNYIIKPSGDTDVMERQTKLQAMLGMWPIVQQTPIAQVFLLKLLSAAFPDDAAVYTQTLQQAVQQQQSAQAQQQAQLQQVGHEVGQGLTNLSKHPEFFSDSGKIHALPKVQEAASMYDKMAGQQ